MATRIAQANTINNNVWSSTLTWQGGTVPLPGDDVVANGITVNVDGTFVVNTIRNDTALGGVAGGSFNLLNGSNLTTTASLGVIVGSATTAPLQFTLPFPESATFNGSIFDVPIGGAAINFNATGTLNLIGDYTIGGGGAAGRRIISANNTGVLNIVGNLTNSGVGGGAGANNTIQSLGATTIYVAGNVIGGGVSTISYAVATISAQFGGSITVTGNVVAAIGIPILMAGGNLTVVGNVTGSSSANAILNVTTVTTMNVIGAVTAGNGAPAISSIGLVSVNGLILNNQTWQGVYSPRILIGTSTKAIRYQTPLLVNQLMWSSGVVTIGQPTPNDVRLGIPYGLAPDNFVGTCIIPNANTVMVGVPVDTTTGTLVMSPGAVIQELNTSTLDIAVRLRNVSTVQTMGAQAASYGI